MRIPLPATEVELCPILRAVEQPRLNSFRGGLPQVLTRGRLHGRHRLSRPATVRLGVIPFTASLKIPPTGGFWIHDERLVMVEVWHAELWIEDADSIALYLHTWRTLRESAVFGAEVHNLISHARRGINIT
ncbi:Scr1 family TA system antitoxin-like transcriptional regulator [Streptomyces sp. NBC_00271]